MVRFDALFPFRLSSRSHVPIPGTKNKGSQERDQIIEASLKKGTTEKAGALPSEMDTGWLHQPGASADAASSSAASASSCGSASKASRLRRGIRLRLRRRRQEPALAARAGGGGAGVQDDLALPLGMSFAAVLAQVRPGDSLAFRAHKKVSILATVHEGSSIFMLTLCLVPNLVMLTRWLTGALEPSEIDIIVFVT